MSDQKITELLDKIGSTNPANHGNVLALRALVQAIAPGVEETVKYGGLHYAAAQPFCGIFAYANHVALEFSRGVELKDPTGLLRGDGKHRRHLRFTDGDVVDPKVVQPYVAEALALANAAP